jgi:hypothetical protein
MWKDEIVEEIHQIREHYAKSFNYVFECHISRPPQKGSRKRQRSCHFVVWQLLVKIGMCV